jgi:dienelactone hydrolase
MMRRLVTFAALALALAASPASAAPAPCGAPPSAVVEPPPPREEAVLGRPTVRSIPAKPRGIIYLFHGSGGSEACAGRLHTRRVLGPMAAAGYGFVAAPSLDRTDVRRWRVDSLDPALNPDVAYMLDLHRALVARGEIAANTPVFTMGMSNGGAFANLFAAAAKAQGLPVVAVANYMGPFPLAMRGDPAALAPTLTVLGQTDGLVSAVQTAEVAAALNGRGARIEVHVAPERRVCTTDLVLAASAPGEPERLLAQLARLGVVDAAGARTVFVSDPVIDRADMAALGQVLAPLGATARDVLNELLIAWGAHQMRSDFGGRQLEFFEAALAARK